MSETQVEQQPARAPPPPPPSAAAAAAAAAAATAAAAPAGTPTCWKKQPAAAMSQPADGNAEHGEHHEQSCAKVLVATAPHSYYDCCIHVHASSLLDHWLDNDVRSPTPASRKRRRRTLCGCRSPPPQPKIAALSTTAPLTPPVSPSPPATAAAAAAAGDADDSSWDPHEWIREVCAAGRDVNTPDPLGRTVLHHLVTGGVNFGDTSLVDLTVLLLRSGADPRLRDDSGAPPLLQLRHLLSKGRFEESAALADLLLRAAEPSLVNETDPAGRTLLSYSVSYGDASAQLTRALLNRGARVWPAAEPGADLVRHVSLERDQSAFPWFLRSVMERQSLENTSRTLYLLSTAMAAENPVKMRNHVTRTMLQLGRGAAVNGLLFLRLKNELKRFWQGPQDLRFLCLKRIRHSLGADGLALGHETLLGLPNQLQRYVRLEDPLPRARPLGADSASSSGSHSPAQAEDELREIDRSMTYPIGEITKALLEQ